MIHQLPHNVIIGGREALCRITYHGRPGQTPASSSLGGSDFAGHPQLTELTCSNPADPARKVVRWRWEGASLQADGVYAAGELDAVLSVDGDGRRSWVFTDCLGRRVLMRAETGDARRYADTYTRGGLPTSVITTLTPPEAGDGTAPVPTRSFTTTAGYDRHGRMLTTQLSLGEAAPITVASNSYDRLGRLQRTEYHGGLWRNSAYDMHGWLTGWHCGFLGQQLLYATGATPSYTGRVSAKLTDSYGHYDRYYYTYDRLGRLAAADFSRRMPPGATAENGDPEADFSTAYTYDLQGNMLSLTRQGLIAPGLYGTVDDITASFSGNRLSELRDDAPTVLLEASLDLPEGAWSGSDFAYDANGNQTRDMSRGVSDVSYNVLNLPQRVEFADGGRIDYLYSASGTKLAETVYDAAGTLISRRDYIGQFEFAADTLERTLLPEGFITAADSTFHAYIPDYQGNILGVYNSSTNTLEQFTDYYPYGLPHASATSPTVNRRKYGAKELTADLGLNLYDFAARWHNPAFPAFTTPDPLAEKKYGFSSYLFCSDDPINFVDPTGLDEYEIDESGNFINRIKNEDYDVVRVVDSDGNKLSESDHYQYGSLDAHMSNKYQPDIGTATIYSYFIVNDFTITRSLFEFLAAYTNVEWTHCEYNDENGQNFNILSTSHFRSRNNSFNCFLREPNNNVNTIKHMAHNHPSGFPIPSGMHNQSGDITEAKKMDKRNKHYPIQYEVYSAKFQIYVPYSAKSIPEDFLYVLSIIQWLNPQFIELLKH